MANPNYGVWPNAEGWQGLSSAIKIGLARNRNNEAEFAAAQNLNGRFDWAGRIYRGDLLSPQFLLRPILIRAAQYQQPQRNGVVVEIPAANPPLSTLDQIRANIR